MNLRPVEKRKPVFVEQAKVIETNSILIALSNIFKSRSEKKYLKSYAKRHELTYREVCRKFDEQTGRTNVYVEEVITYKLALNEVLI